MHDASPLSEKRWDCSFQLSHLDDFIPKSTLNTCSRLGGKRSSVSAVMLCLPNLSGRGVNGCHGVSRVHDALSPLAQLPIVDGRMIGSDEHNIEAGNVSSAPIDGLLTCPA